VTGRAAQSRARWPSERRTVSFPFRPFVLCQQDDLPHSPAGRTSDAGQQLDAPCPTAAVVVAGALDDLADRLRHAPTIPELQPTKISRVTRCGSIRMAVADIAGQYHNGIGPINRKFGAAPTQGVRHGCRDGVTLAPVNKVHHVYTIARVAEMLGEDEDWLWDVANEMDQEDGLVWVYAPPLSRNPSAYNSGFTSCTGHTKTGAH
jgi:hypothetical protein